MNFNKEELQLILDVITEELENKYIQAIWNKNYINKLEDLQCKVSDIITGEYNE